MTRTLSALLLAAVATLTMTAATPATAQSGGADRIAVVDLKEVLEGLTERTEIEAAARVEAQKAEAEQARRVREIEALRGELPMLAEGSDGRRAKEDEIVLRQAELQAYVTVQRNKMGRDQIEAIEALREKMEDVVQQVAQEQGIDLVLTRAIQITLPGPDGRPRSDAVPMVVWAANSADITAQVTERMNRLHQQGKIDAQKESAEANAETDVEPVADQRAARAEAQR
ncbi:MAG: OmpH family outer membrane protein [Planctomycetota bacterium]